MPRRGRKKTESVEEISIDKPTEGVSTGSYAYKAAVHQGDGDGAKEIYQKPGSLEQQHFETSRATSSKTQGKKDIDFPPDSQASRKHFGKKKKPYEEPIEKSDKTVPPVELPSSGAIPKQISEPVLTELKPKEKSDPCIRSTEATDKKRGLGRGKKLKKLIESSQPLTAEDKSKKHIGVISGGVGSLAKDMKALSLKQPMKRPGYGSDGRTIALKVNHFPIKVEPGYIQHYDIKFEDEKMPVRVNRLAFRELVKSDNELKKLFPVFDGRKSVYSKTPFSFGKVKKDFTFKFVDNGIERSTSATIKWAAQLSLYDFLNYCDGKREDFNQATIQALDNVLRYHSTSRFVPVGRSFFQYPDCDISLGGGCQIWSGRFQSARIQQQWKIILNVDVSATAFYKAQELLKFIDEKIERFNPNQEMKRPIALRLTKELKNIKVESNHIPNQKRKYTVRAITDLSARKLTFEMEENGKHSTPTVEQYFFYKYKIQLRFPHLPCLHVGNIKRKIYLPMEICSISKGQRCNKKLNDIQTALMIRHTAKPADQREREILEKIREAKFDEDPHLRAFGLSVETKMAEVTGRVLVAPSVQVGQGQMIIPKDGSWNMQSKKLFSGQSIPKWCIACLDEYFSSSELEKFSKQFSFHSESVGLPFGKHPHEIKYVQRPGDLEPCFERWKHSQVRLAIIILPRRSVNYGDVKRLGDVKVGLMTQCILTKNALNAKPATVINICLKINAKLGGINHIISLQNRLPIFTGKPVIVLGADVTHPAPGENMKPSIAAVVGSLDPHPCKYAASVRVQTHRKEEIVNLAEMVKELLRAFYAATSVKPYKILFYRDGVSEGQFGIVLQEELTAIQRACRELESDYCPGITFVVVQKRHHTRLFCANQRDRVGRAGNVPPGTIVDRYITHPFEFDFYLCSHFGIQGTSRPTHYHVLWDDNNFNPNELQNLTYQLCHTYVRCTRSVSIPAPAYYAHHVAFRARYHLMDQESDSASGSSGDSVNITPEMLDAVKIHPQIKNEMYYA